MRGRFTDGAMRCAALAARLLDWRPSEFWAATPSELALSLGSPENFGAPPSRDEIARMIERDRNG